MSDSCEYVVIEKVIIISDNSWGTIDAINYVDVSGQMINVSYNTSLLPHFLIVGTDVED